VRRIGRQFDGTGNNQQKEGNLLSRRLRNGQRSKPKRTYLRDPAIIAQPAPPMDRTDLAQVRAGDGSRANLRPRLASSKATIGAGR
jgi:hypothetical protein